MGLSSDITVEYADKHGIEIAKDKRGEQPFSIDENILHSSAEGKVLEDPWVEAPDYVYTRTVSLNKHVIRQMK